MVKGLDTFWKYFADYEEQYVLIGGAACDILFENNEVNFRATRDLIKVELRGGTLYCSNEADKFIESV